MIKRLCSLLLLVVVCLTCSCCSQSFDSQGYYLIEDYMVVPMGFPKQEPDDLFIVSLMCWDEYEGDYNYVDAGNVPEVYWVSKIDWNERYIATFAVPDSENDFIRDYNIIDAKEKVYVVETNDYDEFLSKSVAYFPEGVSLKNVRDQAYRAVEPEIKISGDSFHIKG